MVWAAARQSPRVPTPQRQRQDRAAPVAGHRVAGEAEGPADVALRRGGGGMGELRLDAVAADEQLGDGRRRRGAEQHRPAARADGDHDVLDRRGAQHPHRVRRGLLERLEQRVGGLVGEPVGVLDDEHLPPTERRTQRRPADVVADEVGADREAVGADDR